MTLEALEIWLKTSILGIVVLGALGSTTAVLGWKIFQYTVTKIIPVPYLAHKTRSMRRAFTLGYAAATFEGDEKGHTSIIFMAYRLARLIIALFVFVSLLIIFSLVLAFSAEIAVTLGVFVVISSCFIALYWAYSEYEFIRLTYKSFWGRAEDKAKEHQYNRESEQKDEEKT